METAIEHEAQQNKLVLFPIHLDDTVMYTPQAWAADIHRMLTSVIFGSGNNTTSTNKPSLDCCAISSQPLKKRIPKLVDIKVDVKLTTEQVSTSRQKE